MKLLRLLPDQIMNYWDAIKQSIVESLPPTSAKNEESLLRVQEQLLIGVMQAWAGVGEDDITIIYALMTTKVVFDDCDGSKNLLIYSLSTVSAHPESLWEDGYRELSKFAKQSSCNKIIAYTNQQQIVWLIRRLGGDTSWTFLSIPLLNNSKE